MGNHLRAFTLKVFIRWVINVGDLLSQKVGWHSQNFIHSLLGIYSELARRFGQNSDKNYDLQVRI